MDELLKSPSGQVYAEPYQRLGHAYGDLYLAAEHCGLSEPPPFSAPFEWQHGWKPSFLDISPESIVGTDGLSHLRRGTYLQLVATRAQADLLRESGYKKVAAIGLPFTYVPAQGFNRKSESKLHVFSHSTHEDVARFQMAFRQIDLIAELYRGEETYMMVHGANLTSAVVEYAKQRKVRIILGADSGDTQSLVRVRQIFESFDRVVTNYVGSHVLYAMIAGAKISFVEFPKTEPLEPHVQNSKFLRNSPFSHSDFQQTQVLFSRPEILSRFLLEAGITDSKSAFDEAGGAEKPSPEELARLLGWNQPARFQKITHFRSMVQGNLWLGALLLDKLVSRRIRRIRRIWKGVG